MPVELHCGGIGLRSQVGIKRVLFIAQSFRLFWRSFSKIFFEEATDNPEAIIDVFGK